jgi:hypothetical protein
MSYSNYLEDKVLDHAFLGSALTQPSAIWVKLHTGDPGEAGTSNAASETTRKQVTSFAAASGGSKASSAAISWTNYPATETISYVSLWDASTAGNCLGSGAVSPSVAMTGPGSNTLTIASGSITITLD